MSQERLDRLVAGANRAVGLTSNPNYVRLTESTLSLIIGDLVEDLGDAEAVELVAVAEVSHASGTDPGVVVVCADRVVVAWSLGIRSPTTHLRAMPKAALEYSLDLRKAGMLRGWRSDLELRAAGSVVRVALYDEASGVVGRAVSSGCRPTA